jgi:hypothetical protein
MPPGAMGIVVAVGICLRRGWSSLRWTTRIIWFKSRCQSKHQSTREKDGPIVWSGTAQVSLPSPNPDSFVQNIKFVTVVNKYVNSKGANYLLPQISVMTNDAKQWRERKKDCRGGVSKYHDACVLMCMELRTMNR